MSKGRNSKVEKKKPAVEGSGKSKSDYQASKSSVSKLDIPPAKKK
jgi:hypothetical protein